MAKKRAFASDSDVSRFISRKQNPTEARPTKGGQQVTIYPNLNSMLLALTREAMDNEQYQKFIHAYFQRKKATL